MGRDNIVRSRLGNKRRGSRRLDASLGDSASRGHGCETLEGFGGRHRATSVDTCVGERSGEHSERGSGSDSRSARGAFLCWNDRARTTRISRRLTSGEGCLSHPLRPVTYPILVISVPDVAVRVRLSIPPSGELNATHRSAEKAAEVQWTNYYYVPINRILDICPISQQTTEGVKF